MTMMMTSSQFGLEDMEALLWGPSSPMADPMDLLPFHPDREEQQKGGGPSLEGVTSPLTSSSLSSSSSPPFYSPPSSPPAVLLPGDKAGAEPDLLSPSWFGEAQLRRSVSDEGKDDMFSNLDWMAERVDLSQFDLDSLIGSCSPHDQSPGSPDDLLASLECSMELDPVSTPELLTTAPPGLPASPPPADPGPPPIAADESEPCSDDQDVPSPPFVVPEPQEELEIKSEPASPDPSSPAYTLDLGSEVDVSESEVKPVVAPVVPQVQRLVLSLSPTRILLVLAPKKEVSIATVAPAPSQTPRPSRSRPYPEPPHQACPPSTSGVSVRGAGGDEKAGLKAPKAKKLKKMEQNKTAATRYRQKKRAEQDALSEEHALLERRNMELKEKAESMAREIEYLKELMEEVRTARTMKGLSADP
ncbi:activating transcription factor 4b [Halichoeres trimaculatus]|uniref:activating transcription factor 4b n=1 Tax=Halichoeres trimaculatus TaxID=147232 RepID=UPI003D9F58F8